MELNYEEKCCLMDAVYHRIFDLEKLLTLVSDPELLSAYRKESDSLNCVLDKIFKSL